MDKTPKPRGGPNRNQGKKNRAEQGLEPLVLSSVKIEPSIAKTCQEIYGSIRSALTWAAKNHPKKL